MIASINCSWHSSEDKEFERLQDLDIPIFAASGNQKKDKINYPGSLPWVMSIGAWDMKKSMKETYSNYGEGLDCLIPDNIYWLSGKGEPMTDDRTSFCSPVIPRMLRLTGRDYGRQEAYDFVKINCKDVLEKGWDAKSGYGIFVLPKLEVPVMADVKLLRPDLQSKALKLVELAKTKGLNIVISQTLRTEEEQQALYAQGRTKPGNIVTKVTYPYSLHNWGVAFDIAVIKDGKANWEEKYYNIVGPLGESLGLEWGGAWGDFKDRPHFQIPDIEVTDLIRGYSTPFHYIKSWTAPKKEAKDVEKKVFDFEGKAKVIFEGKEVPAGLMGGKTYVELSELAKLLNLNKDWDNQNKTATLSRK